MKKISSVFVLVFATMTSMAFSMNNNVTTLQNLKEKKDTQTLQEYLSAGGEHNVPTERRTLYLKRRPIELTTENKKILEEMIEKAFDNGEINEEEREKALEDLHNGGPILLKMSNSEGSLQSSDNGDIISLEKLTDEEIEKIALENIDKRCECRAGKLVNWFIGRPLRTAVLKSNKLVTILSAGVSTALTTTGLTRLILSMINKVELIPAINGITQGIEVPAGLYQLLTDPITFFAQIAVSYGLFVVGGLSFVVAYAAYEGDNFLQEEVQRIREEELCLHEKGLTWEQGAQLKALEEKWSLKWDKRRAHVLKTMLQKNPKCSPKKLNQAINDLPKSYLLGGFLAEMDMPELTQAINEVDRKVLSDMRDSKERFIEFCKKENHVTSKN